jgi:hypothetical protein
VAAVGENRERTIARPATGASPSPAAPAAAPQGESSQMAAIALLEKLHLHALRKQRRGGGLTLQDFPFSVSRGRRRVVTQTQSINHIWQGVSRDPDSTARAVLNPNPVIVGRRANCNLRNQITWSARSTEGSRGRAERARKARKPSAGRKTRCARRAQASDAKRSVMREGAHGAACGHIAHPIFPLCLRAPKKV